MSQSKTSTDYKFFILVFFYIFIIIYEIYLDNVLNLFSIQYE